ncbi:hypothetical protein GGR53DRAFT_180620 [Hypoxylon sp. FL1150]|nr:hypothetical protein GGR53DRAFT_180620 [Hypoxylon sp. FL1150]
MDPLSITVSSIALLQACSAVLNICYNAYEILKDRPGAISKVQDEVRGLRGVLEDLFQLAIDDEKSNGYHGRKPALKVLAQSQAEKGPLVLCSEDLGALEKILLAKFSKQPEDKFRAVLQAVSWTLTEKEIKPVLERLARSKAALNLAISADEVALLLELRKMSSSMADDVVNIDRNLEELTSQFSAQNMGQAQERILKWLSPVDPWGSYNSAVHRCHDGTGLWFLESKEFQDWRDQGGRNLWLSGFPGSGKTTLLSNVIRHLLLWAEQDEIRRPMIAYFYCDFRNNKSQTLTNLLGSIIRQFLRIGGAIPSPVEDAFASSTGAGHNREPQVDFLLKALELISCEGRIIVLIDALDEIEDRAESLNFFRHVHETLKNISFLVTSRDEQEIRQSLVGFRNVRIEDQVAKVDGDIAKYTRYRLETDPSLQWLNDDIKGDISESMRAKASGMFRWVQCQLDTLSELRTVRAIRHSLKELPHDLYETYDRILARISPADQVFARRVLLWVSFAAMPLTLKELHTAIAIETDMDYLDEESLLHDPNEILSLVSGLITISDQGHITIAHMSVKDYLLSPKTRQSQMASSFALTAKDSYAVLFQSCLAYVSFADFRQGPSKTSEDYLERVEKHPLLRHASISWPYYYRLAIPNEDLTASAMHFLSEDGDRELFMSWVQAINADSLFYWNFYPRHATGLYYAATFGLTDLVDRLIKSGADLNAPGSRYGGTALHGAVWRNHGAAAKLLLEAGADVNKRDSHRMSPLHLASVTNNDKLASLLLSFSADTEIRDFKGRRPLEMHLDHSQKEGWEAKAATRVRG